MLANSQVYLQFNNKLILIFGNDEDSKVTIINILN